MSEERRMRRKQQRWPDRKRSQCPVCKRTIRVNSAGNLVDHAIEGQGAREFRPLCGGSGTPVLSEQEREVMISALRDEAERDLKRAGCTCEPRWSLSENLFGPYHLPQWQSEHDDDCAAVKAAGMKGDEKALLVGESIMERLRRGSR